ncbi:uncharacterized protein [Primulina eburnea]|uniref:uncharacterized protein isoform X2 n=1 Tax=Primulina eburnea TaxID=1245227 RepID=UPI003C6C2CE5
MGRRKERRIAAISAAGRRVKLDLCVEPSGDLGGSSAQDELGGDSDSRTQAELPDSPSSSGPQLNNPLMLLEQYSDDDVDELLSEGQDAGAAKDPSYEVDDTTKGIGEETTEDIGTDDVNDPSVQVVKQLEMDNDDSVSQDLLQKFGKGVSSFSYTDDLHRETKAIEEGIHAATHSEPVGDESSSWKKVLHEESSQYYYWNILTGETSWEVPDVLAQATVVSHPEKTVGDTSGTSVDVEQEDATFEKLKEGSEAIYKTSGNSSKGAEANGFEEGSKGDSLGNEIANTDACQNCQTSLLDDAPVVNDAKYNCNLLSIDCKSGTHFVARLLKHCDILLERLNSLESLNWNLQWQDIKLKYKLEVEIRLSDIMTLASHGSALLQFWLYTEEQLKRLDAAIDDAIRQYGSAPIGEYEATVKSQEAFKVDSNEKKGPCQAAKESNHPDSTFEKSHIEAYSDLATTTGLVSSLVNPITCSNTETEGKDEIVGLEVQSEIISKSVVYCGEEVDMDVDMEVEDTSTSLKSSIGGASGAHYDILSHEQSNLQHPPAVHEPLLQGQMFSVQPPATSWIHQLSLENGPCPPPPPDNEPFPPPPPDDYPFPPPPPDEPPETSYPPPSHFESVHSLPYSEHYVLTYPSSNLDYFGQSNTEISGATLYSHPEGVQVSASHITPYYEPVSNIYAVTPLVGNPGEPSSYYGLQNGSLNHPSLVSGAAVESSRIQSETVLTNKDIDTTCSLGSHAETAYDLFPKANPSVVKYGQGSVKEAEFLDAQLAIGSQSTTSTSHGANALSASDTPTFVSAAAASSKVQSKVSRSKKRNVAMVSTLRSNKKVSSLVDKWKAAKEELHEEEEEPENVYEMLERKRQREIEEWQAQQIASGEAKENANFQPLGGDWRERVKRKRAQQMKETEHNVSKPTGPEEPNLVELSRDLPSGWQAYWDDSSKKVYYGNAVTSETTWNKPKH